MATHHLDDKQPHAFWDNSWPARGRIRSGDTVVFETLEASAHHLTPGTRVVFPVLVPGALFSCGDCHSAQGDGEVNGTGIETPMTVTLRFRLLKGGEPPELRFTTPPGRKLTVADEGGYFVTTAHGPDLFQDAQQALRYMLDYLVREHDLTRDHAYCLAGAPGDLKITQIVYAP